MILIYFQKEDAAEKGTEMTFYKSIRTRTALLSPRELQRILLKLTWQQSVHHRRHNLKLRMRVPTLSTR